MTPTVSVILNCYNHEPYVAEALESVLGQTYRDFELILIDNGSTDGTRAILERYDDPRVRRVFHDRNESLSKRLNEGVAMARGAFVAVLYSDDMMLPDKLERQVALFHGLPEDYGVVYCPAIGLNQWTGERWQHRSMATSGTMMPAILRRHFAGGIDMSSPLTRRECFEPYHWHEDLFGDGEGIFFRIAMRWKFHFDPQPTVVLRDHGGNLGKAVRSNHDLLMVMLDRLRMHPDFRPEWSRDLDHFRKAACRNNAWAVLRAGGDRQWARWQLRRAIECDPRELLNPRTLSALLLASLPSKAGTTVNRLVDQLKRRPENRVTT